MSIQQVIQEKLSLLVGEKVEITGSGRTDAGVHARQQFFHADFEKDILNEDFKYHANAVLPNDIVIHSVRKVQDRAHTRFDAVSRAYSYELIQLKNPFTIDQAYIYNKYLDIDKLNAAAEILIGKHDFESFSKVKTQVNNFNCEVFKAFWQKDGQLTCFRIEANRFLRGMVRAIVGTLLLVNENKLTVEDVRKILADKDRSKAGRSVPSEGLYLEDIKYPEHIYIN
jgi:tRNA pseudouridine38-40 synthase